MGQVLKTEELEQLSPVGYHIALRIGFAFPLVEINEWPHRWIAHYTMQRLVLRDPVMRWVYGETGAIRWSEIDDPDPHRVLAQAHAFGLRYGAAVACRDEGPRGMRSFGIFARSDREFRDEELAPLLDHVTSLHIERAPPKNLTAAELEALGMVSEGLRQKEIAYRLGVTEGAVKQRLRNAKTKLQAQTAAQAATMARDFGLI